MTLRLRPITQRAAFAFIDQHHSHHKPPRGWKFGIAVEDDGRVCGVVTVGRPVAREWDDNTTAEVNRCCTDRTPHVASMLYGAAARAAKAMGYERIITYTLASESGVSLLASGWTMGERRRDNRTWSCESRPRSEAAQVREAKRLWVKPLI